jgi:hypothetical protein
VNEKPRKPYVKPEIEQITLTPEEAVLAGCKTFTITGPEFTNGCTLAANCMEQRS